TSNYKSIPDSFVATFVASFIDPIGRVLCISDRQRFRQGKRQRWREKKWLAPGRQGGGDGESRWENDRTPSHANNVKSLQALQAFFFSVLLVQGCSSTSPAWADIK